MHKSIKAVQLALIINFEISSAEISSSKEVVILHTNDIESVYEIIKHEENGLILNFKRDSLVDELDILNKENKVSEILSLKSYDSAKNFSLEKAAEKELGDYNKILVT